jgi:hypothetical protein
MTTYQITFTDFYGNILKKFFITANRISHATAMASEYAIKHRLHLYSNWEVLDFHTLTGITNSGH